MQQELEFLEVQEEYIKDEQKNLKKEFLHAQEEVKRIQSIPLVIGQFLEAVDQNTAIVGSTTGTVPSFLLPIYLQWASSRFEEAVDKVRSGRGPCSVCVPQVVVANSNQQHSYLY